MAFIIITVALLIAVSLFVMITANVNKNMANTVEPSSIDWGAINDPELQSYLPHQKINAIRVYREITGVGLKEAKEAVEFAMAYPEKGIGKKGKSASAIGNTEGAGIHDLLDEGRFDEAVDVYAAFMGVDEFSARSAVEQMQRQRSAENNLSVEGMDEVHRLVAEGQKIHAIKLYREMTDVGLQEAKDTIDQIDNEMR